MIDKAALLRFVVARDGAPFLHQGRGPVGFDCVGLVLAALEDQGVVVDAPRNYGRYPTGRVLLDTIEKAGLVHRVTSSELEAADVLLFTMSPELGPQHMAVYIGENQFMHAVSTSQFVRRGSLGHYWLDRLTHTYRWNDVD
jgi:cell wall-associated NlpC family hydrolase